MRPDPAFVARLLALPIEARRRLLVPGPGYLIDEYGAWVLRNHPPAGLLRGESWYPADSAAWMKAAAGARHWLLDSTDGIEAAIIVRFADEGGTIRAATAEECALSWFETAGTPLAPDP